MRILLIEDNPEFSSAAVELLESYGHTCAVLKSADDAIDSIADLSSFDIVILDAMLRLGKKIKASEATETGIAIFKRIRLQNPKKPVVFLTALKKSEISEEVTFDAITAYHSKPIPSASERFRLIVEGVFK